MRTFPRALVLLLGLIGLSKSWLISVSSISWLLSPALGTGVPVWSIWSSSSSEDVSAASSPSLSSSVLFSSSSESSESPSFSSVLELGINYIKQSTNFLLKSIHITLFDYIKVSKFQNEFIRSSFLLKHEQGRNPYVIWFIWFKRSFWNLLTFNISQIRYKFYGNFVES